MPAVMHGIDTVVLDVDGTLVDSVYEHAVAWGRAFHDVGLTIPSQVVHGAIGMGSSSWWRTWPATQPSVVSATRCGRSTTRSSTSSVPGCDCCRAPTG